MSRSIDLDVRVRGAATAKRDLDSVGESMQQLSRRYRTYSSLLRSASRLAIQFSIGIWIIMSTMRRARQTTWALEDAQRAYTKALREHGASSEEAREAHRRLERATINQNEAMLQNVLTTGTWLANVALVIPRVYAEVIAIQASTAATWEKVAAVNALNTAQAAGGIGLGLGGILGLGAAAVGGLAVGALIGQATNPTRSKYERTTPPAYGHQGGGSGGGVTFNVSRIEVSPKGKSVAAFMEETRQTVRASRGEVW